MIKGVDDKAEKMSAIKQIFEPMIGKKLLRIETALLKMDDGSWDDWLDLPVRLFFGPEKLASVAWSYFDKLFITNDHSVPFDLGDAEINWNTNRIQCLRSLVEQQLKSVWLGRGEMTWDDQDVEIWTRLLLEFDEGWIEIYNGLDENAFAFHTAKPTGTFERIH